VIPVLVQPAPWPLQQGLPTSLERLSLCTPISLQDARQFEVVAAQLQRVALREELRHMPRVAYPALVALTLLTALVGIPLVLHITFGLIITPPTVTDLMSDIVRYTGLVALAIGVWHAVRARLWWWIPVWAALTVFAAAWPHALRYPLASGLGLALLVF